MTKELVIKRLKLLSENKGVQTLSYDEARILLAEIERLNNIINELENEFDSVIKDPLIHMCYKRLARKYADKLQELKGSNSNE